jgi:hypothetical protein
VNPCLRIIVHTRSRPGGRWLPEQWAAMSGLTGFHAIDWIMVCFHICNRKLVCGEGTSLDCCDVVVATGYFGVAIITLSRLYFVLSCRLSPPDALFMLYGRRTYSGAIGVLTSTTTKKVLSAGW